MIDIPKGDKAVAESEYSEQFGAADLKALEVILSMAGNRLVPISVPKKKGVKPYHMVTSRTSELTIIEQVKAAHPRGV